MDPCTNIAIDARERRTTSWAIVAPFEARPLDARRLGALAAQALREEAMLTPKPGLVDRRGSGAHADMDLALLLRSADALEPHFVRVAESAATMPFGAALRARLGRIGREAEVAMLATTDGVNTHRGAIWALGLLVAAHASLTGSLFKSGRMEDRGSTSFTRLSTAEPAKRESSAVLASGNSGSKPLDSRLRGNDELDAICRRAGHIARIATIAEVSRGHGAAMHEHFGARGARGEAQDGFPHVRNVALPALCSARRRYDDEPTARLHALVALITTLDDTCLLYRGGAEALAFAQGGARRVLDRGLDSKDGWRALDELDRGLLARNASPGGSADLLAATLLLERIESLKVESLHRQSFHAESAHDESLRVESLHVESLHVESVHVESLHVEAVRVESATEATDGNA
jgi:triphosphoribosyl-dephospho-CoA synthase